MTEPTDGPLSRLQSILWLVASEAYGTVARTTSPACCSEFLASAHMALQAVVLSTTQASCAT